MLDVGIWNPILCRWILCIKFIETRRCPVIFKEDKKLLRAGGRFWSLLDWWNPCRSGQLLVLVLTRPSYLLLHHSRINMVFNLRAPMHSRTSNSYRFDLLLNFKLKLNCKFYAYTQAYLHILNAKSYHRPELFAFWMYFAFKAFINALKNKSTKRTH